MGSPLYLLLLCRCSESRVARLLASWPWVHLAPHTFGVYIFHAHVIKLYQFTLHHLSHLDLTGVQCSRRDTCELTFSSYVGLFAQSLFVGYFATALIHEPLQQIWNRKVFCSHRPNGDLI